MQTLFNLRYILESLFGKDNLDLIINILIKIHLLIKYNINKGGRKINAINKIFDDDK